MDEWTDSAFIGKVNEYFGCTKIELKIMRCDFPCMMTR